jgi:SPP1 gp7 family putative phage head morphogenesis protein
MPTVNEEFLDALIRHQVYLMRLSGSIRDKVLRLLDATEKDIEAAILRRLAKRQGFDSQAASRLRVLQGMITRIRGGAWDKAIDTWMEELTELAKYEPAFMANVLRTVSPVVLDFVMPSVEQLREIVRARPFEGKVMKDWASGQRRDDLQRIMSQIQIGMTQGESAQQITRRVFGTTQARGVDGITEITRRNAEAITRTAVNHISNATRRAFMVSNESLFDFERFVATLDSRTTPVCRANDGKKFKVGQGPIPPLHYNCRSTRVAVIGADVLGERPAKPVTERMLVREYNQKHGLSAKTRDDLPRGHKGPYDSFARGRIRDLTGTVPAATSYQQWLARQSAEFQDDVLGKARGALFRRGGLTLDKFVNRQGDQINLKQLAKRERAAFLKAGLSPDEYM